MAPRTNTELIDVIDDVLGTTLSLVGDLTEHDADLPTDCPGWTVRDQLAHMVGLEQVLAGAPLPDIELPPLDHVVSDADIFMEKPVHARRNLPLVAISDELAGMRPRRVADLRRTAEQGDPLVAGPFGERRLSASLPVRVFDLWAHEQDIRRAVGLPVRTDGEAAEIALDRTLAAWTSALPARVDGVDGSLVVRRSDQPRSEVRIELGAGAGGSAMLTGDLGELTRLFCGRVTPTDDQLTGDPTVVDALRPRLALTP